VVDGEEPGVDSRDEGKHTGRNDLKFYLNKMVPVNSTHYAKLYPQNGADIVTIDCVT